MGVEMNECGCVYESKREEWKAERLSALVGENSRRKDEFFSSSKAVSALRIAVQTSHERERAGLKTFLRHTRNLFFSVVNKETVSGEEKKTRGSEQEEA